VGSAQAEEGEGPDCHLRDKGLVLGHLLESRADRHMEEGFQRALRAKSGGLPTCCLFEGNGRGYLLTDGLLIGSCVREERQGGCAGLRSLRKGTCSGRPSAINEYSFTLQDYCSESRD
jgi:hypothetical protein